MYLDVNYLYLNNSESSSLSTRTHFWSELGNHSLILRGGDSRIENQLYSHRGVVGGYQLKCVIANLDI